LKFKTFEKEKYNEIIRICCLKQDFDSLISGDQTAIGEKGSFLI
jgi:hypothetical protein